MNNTKKKTTAKEVAELHYSMVWLIDTVNNNICKHVLTERHKEYMAEGKDLYLPVKIVVDQLHNSDATVKTHQNGVRVVVEEVLTNEE